ncbi:hypothetical protein B0H15DRAFT_958766 [Mycena belliarum]|uniref:Uncharacterized protein n=1 Tax=Mycena belliarum TaxID=1033014 RepID=A0AAD6XD64_9AGAR|nr:hypothetical protein B0H15DRAFT_958766 [Mycena belliae]
MFSTRLTPLSLSVSYHTETPTLTLTTRTDDSRSPWILCYDAPPSVRPLALRQGGHLLHVRDSSPPTQSTCAAGSSQTGGAEGPSKRKLQWFRKCRGQRQRWWCYWRVPFAAKFERLIHLHFKLRGAWLGRQPCDFCPTKHQEKYDLEGCGGRAGVRAAVELYLVFSDGVSIDFASSHSDSAGTDFASLPFGKHRPQRRGLESGFKRLLTTWKVEPASRPSSYHTPTPPPGPANGLGLPTIYLHLFTLD